MLSNKEMLKMIFDAELGAEIWIDHSEHDIIVCDSECDDCSLSQVCDQLSDGKNYPKYLENVNKLFEGLEDDN